MEDKQVIEINGVKLEVDMRYAKRIDTLRVGSPVKVLLKEYSSHKVSPGVVVGFEPFDKLPTIIVAYMDVGYSQADLRFVHINSENKDIEIVPSVDDELPIDKADVLCTFDRQREKARQEIEEIDRKQQYFLRNFNMYFEQQLTEKA